MLSPRYLFKNQVRSMAVKQCPPSNPLSTGDKILHGLILVFCYLSVPIMLSVRSLTKLVPHVRNMSALSGPPSVHISRIEKVCHGLVIVGSCLVIPGYVLCNIHMIGLTLRSAGKFNRHVRHQSIKSGPPSNRMSFAEKCGHVAFSYVVMFIIPVYISLNIPYYRGIENTKKDTD